MTLTVANQQKQCKWLSLLFCIFLFNQKENELFHIQVKKYAVIFIGNVSQIMLTIILDLLSIDCTYIGIYKMIID